MKKKKTKPDCTFLTFKLFFMSFSLSRAQVHNSCSITYAMDSLMNMMVYRRFDISQVVSIVSRSIHWLAMM